VSKGERALTLTHEQFPKDIRVLSFVPGKRLKINIPLPKIQQLWLLGFSSIFYLIGGYLIASSLEWAFAAPPVVSLVILLLALATCIAMNRRGAVLTVCFAPVRYCLSTSCSIACANRLPDVGIQTTRRGQAWESVLSIASLPVATRMSAISAEDAQSDFEALAQAFAPSPAVITQAAPTRTDGALS
jgi:hypothetical protein